MNKKWICLRPIAHRGLHNKKIIENTMEAYKNAAVNNFLIELDIQMTHDNKLVISHDYTLKRIFNNDNTISKTNLEELKKIKIPKTDLSILTLDEVLKEINSKVGILIHIKFIEKIDVLIEELKKVVKNYHGKLAFFTFDDKLLKKLLSIEEFKDVLIGKEIIKLNSKLTADLFSIILKIPYLARESKREYDFYIINYKYKKLLKKLNNKDIIIFLINNENDYKEYKDKYCNVVFENFIPS